MKLTNVWRPANDSVLHFKRVLGNYVLIDNPKYCNTKVHLVHGICVRVNCDFFLLLFRFVFSVRLLVLFRLFSYGS